MFQFLLPRARVLCAAILMLTFQLLASPVHAATLPTGFSETLIATGLVTPTAFELAPDGRIFVTQQGGALRVIKNGSLLAIPFVTVTTDSTNERGLLGLAFDPNFATNQFLYVYYTVPSTPRHNRVSRFTANGDVATADPEVILLELEDLNATNHNGGAIHFGPDGKLYIAVGENAVAANAQTLTNRLGKILRLNADGTIPTDNPFYNTSKCDNRAIWAMGLRNPFTFAFQPGTTRMFINDVGQNTWEEFNDGIAGSNYGWNICEGFCNPPNASYRDPLLAYPHSGGDFNGCAIVGGAFYNPTTAQFPADYTSDYFFADLCRGYIRRYDIATNTSSEFATGLSTPVDLHVSTDGALYYLARGGGGQLYRIIYNSAAPTNTPTNTPTLTRTITPTPTPTSTNTPTNSPTFTRTLTNTPTNTPTNTQTNAPTATKTFTPTATRTNTSTRTNTPTATRTNTPRPNTPTRTRTRTATRTHTPTRTLTPTITRTRTKTLTPTRTLSPTATPIGGTWTFCANQNQLCTVPGTRLVRFGANGKFRYRTVTNSIFCIATNFGGDPIAGVLKKCEYASANAPTPTNTPTPTRRPAKKERGLRGTYFDNDDLTAPMAERLDARLDFAFGKDAPDLALSPESYSIRWDGTLRSRVAGEYTFRVETDGGVRLEIDGAQIIEAWDAHGGAHTAVLYLEAKKKYRIKLEYRHDSGDAFLRLYWQNEQSAQAIIPKRAFRPK